MKSKEMLFSKQKPRKTANMKKAAATFCGQWEILSAKTKTITWDRSNLFKTLFFIL